MALIIDGNLADPTSDELKLELVNFLLDPMKREDRAKMPVFFFKVERHIEGYKQLFRMLHNRLGTFEAKASAYTKPYRFNEPVFRMTIARDQNQVRIFNLLMRATSEAPAFHYSLTRQYAPEVMDSRAANGHWLDQEPHDYLAEGIFRFNNAVEEYVQKEIGAFLFTMSDVTKWLEQQNATFMWDRQWPDLLLVVPDKKTAAYIKLAYS